ncbi:MAG TPA: FeoA family protein [Steroidobacteraceae bacterium]|jgi:ferrous iron transport protein A|nr:FeoA family protein [Steroidobacteraceae bacterium]
MDSCRSWHDAALASTGQADAVRSLAQLHKGERGVVSAIAAGTAPGSAAAMASIGNVAGSTIVRRLMELGFVPGERIEVIEEQRPGGDPIAVRIGCSMFALRRREAQAVMVRLDQPSDAAPR